MGKTATAPKANSFIPLLKNMGVMLLGVITGQVAGSAIGKASALAGIVAGGAGFHLLKKKSNQEWIGYFLISSGAGLIASPLVAVNPSQVSGLDGFEGFAMDAKEGATQSLKQLGLKLFLDKTPLAPHIGLGNVEDGMMGFGDAPLSQGEAQRVISQLIAEQNQNVNGLGFAEDDYQVQGIEEGIEGMDGSDELDGLDGSEDEFGDFGDLGYSEYQEM